MQKINAEEKVVDHMKQAYWEQFAETGRVEDYLYYKGIETCQNIMEKYEDRKSESTNHSDRDGVAGGTYRGI